MELNRTGSTKLFRLLPDPKTHLKIRFSHKYPEIPNFQVGGMRRSLVNLSHMYAKPQVLARPIRPILPDLPDFARFYAPGGAARTLPSTRAGGQDDVS